MNRVKFIGSSGQLQTPLPPPAPIFIGSGTSLEAKLPLYFYYDYGVFIFLYKQSEIGTAKNISEIAFDMINTYSSTYVANNQTLKFAHTSLTEIPNNVKSDLTGFTHTDLTVVASDFTWTVDTTDGYTPITLETNFAYNGTDSLLVIWENRDGSYISGSSSNPKARVTSDGTFNVWYDYQDSSFPSSTFGTKDSTGKPNIKITFS